jgi:hypothetical protein
MPRKLEKPSPLERTLHDSKTRKLLEPWYFTHY